jgi:hypothetical protein
VTAQVVASGQVALDSSSLLQNVGIKLISLIPFIGEAIASPLDSVITFCSEAQMIKKSNNICKLASNQSEFDTLIQDVAIDLISHRKAEIKSQKEDEVVSGWIHEVTKFLELGKLKYEETVYGLRYTTTNQVAGNQEACQLLSNWIANGNIYGGKPFLLQNVKKQALVDVLTGMPGELKKVREKHVEKQNKTQPEPVKPEDIKTVKEKSKNKCCQLI